MSEFLRRAEEKCFAISIKVEVDDKTEKPVVLIHQGSDAVAFEAEEWSVIRDAIDRCIEFVGEHPDAET